MCICAIGIILSSKETHSTYCTEEALGRVKECHDKHSTDDIIRQFYLGLLREKGTKDSKSLEGPEVPKVREKARYEDTKVREAVSKGECTKKYYPKCRPDCECNDNVYCPKCCVQQKVYRCKTCDGNCWGSALKLYCETCWNNDHKDHEVEEFF